MDQKRMDFESTFDINSMSFDNVSNEFERKFRERYNKSLNAMSDAKNKLVNASGANSLGVLEKMASRISYYDRSSDFDESYNQMLEEYESFTDT